MAGRERREEKGRGRRSPPGSEEEPKEAQHDCQGHRETCGEDHSAVPFPFAFPVKDLERSGNTLTAMANKFEALQKEVQRDDRELHPDIILDMLVVSPVSIRLVGSLERVRREMLLVAGASASQLGRLGSADVDVEAIQRSIFSAKNHDYGASYATTGLLGVLVRMVDKLKRLQRLQSHAALVSESRMDTLLDLSVYALLAILCIDDMRTPRPQNIDEECEWSVPPPALPHAHEAHPREPEAGQGLRARSPRLTRSVAALSPRLSPYRT